MSWELAHSVEADVTVPLAWNFWTTVSNWDDPPAAFVLDGPFGEGVTGQTLLPGQAPLRWRVRDVLPGRSATIEMPLDRATLSFTWSFEAVGDRRTKLTQRIVLAGENAASYRSQVEEGFAPNLPVGMQRIAAAMENVARGNPQAPQ
jgi:hypothetical protein